MISTGLLLLFSAVIIYLSCEYFVNGIEWVGHKFNFTKNPTGTVLAAFGTALPESVVTFVAVVFGSNQAQRDIGVGAAIGGPLVLSTIAYAVVGWTFITNIKQRNQQFISKETELRLGYDQLWFMIIFAFKVILGLVTFIFKPWLGILFLAAYAAYVRQEINGSDDPEHLEFLEPLKIRPGHQNPSHGWVLLQTGLSLTVIFVSSNFFVHQLDAIGPLLGLPSQLVALLLSPIATELPEIMNAVIWVRQGKQTLALANISGAMMIQATIPSALGIFFTPWLLDGILVWGAVITMVSILAIHLLLRNSALNGRRLSYFGLLYAVFALAFLKS